MRYFGTIDAMHAAATARARIAGCAPLCAVLLVAAAFGGVVDIDLDGLLAGLDIAVAENCVEANGEREECRQLLTRLGLDADTGLCADDCARQSLFRYEAARS